MLGVSAIAETRFFGLFLDAKRVQLLYIMAVAKLFIVDSGGRERKSNGTSPPHRVLLLCNTIYIYINKYVHIYIYKYIEDFMPNQSTSDLETVQILLPRFSHHFIVPMTRLFMKIPIGQFLAKYYEFLVKTKHDFIQTKKKNR